MDKNSMDAASLRDLRKNLKLTQAQMAECMGMSARAYQDIECGASDIRGVHALAAERVALALAIEKRDPMLAPIGVRREALELARMIAG